VAPNPDPEVDRLAALPVSALADVLDRLDHRSQTMEHAVRPLQGGPVSLAGRAFTIAASASEELLENPYEHELAAVDATPPGAVVVLATGGLLDVAVWGELLTTRMLARGGVGVVTDGGIRDVAGIRDLGVPAFSAAITPRDSFGRALVTGWGEPVTCAGVAVAAGDLVRGDEDGVVVVPSGLAADALAAAEEKLGLERIVQDALARGESATELYDRYGVL
jgi:regulator of RNase E activity RraA